MKLVKGEGKSRARTSTIKSDKSMDEVVDFFKAMEEKGEGRVIRSGHLSELEKVPVNELSPAERKVLMLWNSALI